MECEIGEVKINEVYCILIDWNGWRFNAVYGYWETGWQNWFIAIPNWSVCTELSHPRDDFHNTGRLEKAGLQEDKAGVVAKAVKEHWGRIHNDG